MSRTSILFCVLSFFSFGCSHSQVKAKINPEAIKLNNQAVQLEIGSSTSQNDRNKKLQKAINLLDSAIKIDSNDFTAYWNKLSCQYGLEQYKGALQTGKQIMKIRPNNVDIINIIGTLYERTGDTLSSVKYYKESLLRYSGILDAMSNANKNYKGVETGKAFALIMLHQQTEGDAIFKKLAEEENDHNTKEMYLGLMSMSRADFLNGRQGPSVTSEDAKLITH